MQVNPQQRERGGVYSCASYATSDERPYIDALIRDGNGFASRFGRDKHVVRFDGEAFPFRRLLMDELVSRGLLSAAVEAERLHDHLDPALQPFDHTGINPISRMFYEMGSAFQDAYRLFVRDILTNVVGDALVFQETPTIRFNFPFMNRMEIRPNYHSDIMLGHPPQEFNVWLPFTKCYGTNSIRLCPLAASRTLLIESGYDFAALAEKVQDDAMQSYLHGVSEDVELDYGEALLFDSRCLHTTQKNDTADTRISMDIRVIPAGDFAAMRKVFVGTGRRALRFDLGGYYAPEPSVVKQPTGA
jgi:hypothetical protein